MSLLGIPIVSLNVVRATLIREIQFDTHFSVEFGWICAVSAPWAARTDAGDSRREGHLAAGQAILVEGNHSHVK